MAGVEHIELKFRIYDGTDIGHGAYTSSTTVAALKEKLLDEWPQDKSAIPKSTAEITLVHAGKILDDRQTLAEHIRNIGGIVITMHVVVQPIQTRKKTGKRLPENRSCSCSIL